MSEQVSFEDVKNEIKGFIRDLRDFSRFGEDELYIRLLEASKSQVSKSLSKIVIIYEKKRDLLPEGKKERFEGLIRLMVKNEAREWLNKYIRAMMGRMRKGIETRDVDKSLEGVSEVGGE